MTLCRRFSPRSPRGRRVPATLLGSPRAAHPSPGQSLGTHDSSGGAVLVVESHQLGGVSRRVSQVDLTPLCHPLNQLGGLGDVRSEMENVGVPDVPSEPCFTPRVVTERVLQKVHESVGVVVDRMCAGHDRPRRERDSDPIQLDCPDLAGSSAHGPRTPTAAGNRWAVPLVKALLDQRRRFVKEPIESGHTPHFSAGLFGSDVSRSEAAPTTDLTVLHAKIAELTLEKDFLVGALSKAGFLQLSRGSLYYKNRPVAAAALAIMRWIDELHLEYPFAGSRMLRDLLRGEGVEIGRERVAQMMRRMDIVAIYRRPNTVGRAFSTPIRAVNPSSRRRRNSHVDHS